jgi:hypothetical protein
LLFPISVLVLIIAVAQGGCEGDSGRKANPIAISFNQPTKPYATDFPLAESPISENNVWINGEVAGLDWTNVHTAAGLAFGTQSGSGAFNDSIAVLAGSWRPDQTVTATVHSVNQQGGNVFEEVELLLRFQLTAHSARGYEVNFRALNDRESYSEVVRWNGPLGNFSYLVKNHGQKFGITDGSVIKASIVGSLITVFINDVLVAEVVDNVYKDGSPGLGFFAAHASGVNRDYGFKRYTATDGTNTMQGSS